MTPVWWILGLIPALVLLYFLKLKRQDVAISSTYLWKRSMEDLHVNSPFQRLRQSLLFFLQLIALCLLILAVWKPRCDRDVQGGRNLIVLIDHSASMNTKERGQTRLEIARSHALSLVEGMVPGDRMQVLRFSSETIVQQPLTSDKALIDAKIRAIEPSSLPTDLPQALMIVNSMAATLDAVEVHVIGDGCYGDMTDLPPEVKRLNIRFINTGSPIDNVGITEADVRRSFGRKKVTELFAFVENFSEEEKTVAVSLFRGDELQRAMEVTLPSGEGESVVFDVSEIEISDGESRVVRLEIDLVGPDGEPAESDAFSEDDRVFLSIPAPKNISVLFVGEGNVFVENAIFFVPNTTLESMKLADYEATRAKPEDDEDAPDPKKWDLIVFDRVGPKAPPGSPAVFIGCKPPLPAGLAEPKMVENPIYMDMDAAHPVNRFMNFSSIHIAKSWVYESSPAFHALIESEDGALIGTFTYREEGQYPARAVVVGFDITESNWPINHHSFPIFFTNAVGWLGVAAEESILRWRTGQTLVYSPGAHAKDSEREGLSFVSPGGEESSARPERSGSIVSGTADEIGVYQLRRDDDVVAEFPVSLVNHQESSLTPAKEIDMGDIKITAETSIESESSDLWRWFALGGLVFLLIEWYVYNRRVYI
jgi:hypothetical protein